MHTWVVTWPWDYLCTFEKEIVWISSYDNLDGVIVFFCSPFSGALKAYLNFNKCLPSRIIVYRDGVGDGMLSTVVNYEVPQIMQSIKAMGTDYMWDRITHFQKKKSHRSDDFGDAVIMLNVCRPKLSVVVVKKRISTRFFALLESKLTNPPPGTVIDSEVTRPEWYVL